MTASFKRHEENGSYGSDGNVNETLAWRLGSGIRPKWAFSECKRTQAFGTGIREAGL